MPYLQSYSAYSRAISAFARSTFGSISPIGGTFGAIDQPIDIVNRRIFVIAKSTNLVLRLDYKSDLPPRRQH